MLVKNFDYLSKEDSEILIENIRNSKHKVIILLMLDAGLRVSEACSIRYKNFDFKNKLITIQSSKKRGEKSLRTIPISDRLYNSISDYLVLNKLDYKPENFLFPTNSADGHISRKTIWLILYNVKNKKGIQGLHPHALRHSFATFHLSEGSKLEEIKSMLGHKNLNTTLIYAEIPTAQLIARVNAVTQKRKSFWQKIFLFFLPKKKTNLININVSESYFTIGRNDELKNLNINIEKGINTILLGKIGVGKSHILNNIETSKNILRLDDTENIKKSLIQILLYLLKEKETVLSVIWQDFTIDEIHKKIQRENTISLCDTISSSVKKHEYILVIDDITSITPSAKKAIERMKDTFIIVCAAREIKAVNTSFLWNFERLEIKPLDRKNSLNLINQLSSGLQVENLEIFRNHIFDQTDGNPRAISELIDRYSKEAFLDNQTIREIKHTGALSEIDMTWLIVVFLGCVTALRYLARDLDEPAFRFIGSIAMIALIMFRPLMRSLKRQFV